MISDMCKILLKVGDAKPFWFMPYISVSTLQNAVKRNEFEVCTFKFQIG